MRFMKYLSLLLLCSLVLTSIVIVQAQSTDSAPLPFALYLPLISSEDEAVTNETFIEAAAVGDVVVDEVVDAEIVEGIVEGSDEEVTSAALTTITRRPTSYTTTSGGSGGQPVTNLHVRDQSGDQNDWDKYVEFLTPSTQRYIGYRTYVLPATLNPATITALQLQANYLGPVKSYQTWTWTIYNWTTRTWVRIGDNAGAPPWQWKSFAWNLSGTLRDYVNSSNRQIRVRLQSNNTNDNMDLDYEALRVTYDNGVTGTATPTRTPTPTATPTHTPTPTQPAPINAFYVATTGNDSNTGMISAPWRTIQKAANSVPAGSTVYVRGGVYPEAVTVSVSGSAAAGYTTFQNYPGETPIIDGNTLTVPETDTALFFIDSQSYLTIKGFTFRNYRSAQDNIYPNGIFITGSAHHITVQNNLIHNIETNVTNFTGDHGAGAHGILVLGTHPTNAIHAIVIDGNELRNLKLGWSESLTLNGNVDGFSITNNQIHDANNIGIDIAGGYSYVEVPAAVNAARNGDIRGNHIYNITSNGNPAYPGVNYSAGGIYVDGGRNVTIERNRIHHVDFGIELAAENANWSTSNVIVRNNFVYHNNSAGLAMGGYNTGRGYTENCTIVNNTFFRNNQQSEGTGELYLQYDTRNNTIQNNIFVAGNDNRFIWNNYVENSGNTINYNIYFAPGGANGSVWHWKQVSYTTFSAYQSATGNDSVSRFIDPQVINATTPDLHLSTTSPAINSGNNGVASVGATDIDGQPRLQGGVIDIGADEVR
jgi:hypothetical protein